MRENKGYNQYLRQLLGYVIILHRCFSINQMGYCVSNRLNTENLVSLKQKKDPQQGLF